MGPKSDHFLLLGPSCATASFEGPKAIVSHNQNPGKLRLVRESPSQTNRCGYPPLQLILYIGLGAPFQYLTDTCWSFNFLLYLQLVIHYLIQDIIHTFWFALFFFGVGLGLGRLSFLRPMGFVLSVTGGAHAAVPFHRLRRAEGLRGGAAKKNAPSRSFRSFSSSRRGVFVFFFSDASRQVNGEFFFFWGGGGVFRFWADVEIRKIRNIGFLHREFHAVRLFTLDFNVFCLLLLLLLLLLGLLFIWVCSCWAEGCRDSRILDSDWTSTRF